MSRRSILALDAGGSHTRAGIYDESGALCAEAEGAGANPVAYGFDTAVHVMAETGRSAMTAAGLTSLSAVTAAVSGAGAGSVAESIGRALCDRLSASEAFVGGDGWPALYATTQWQPAILLISGTGCTVFVHTGAGRTVNVGGRGTLWGEDGGAYGLAVAGLRAAGDSLDGLAPPTVLVEMLPKAASVADFHGLVLWGGPASKADVAGLAKTVMDAAEAGDGVALQCVTEQAAVLARRIAAGLRKGDLPDDAPIVYHGGFIETAHLFRQSLERALGRTLLPPALRSHAAVAALYRAADRPETVGTRVEGSATRLASTEARSPQGAALDSLDAAGIVRTMHKADHEALRAVGRAFPGLTAVIEQAAQSLMDGGRIVYTGAGTSGRLGVLDASECPPTFGIAPDRVVALLAGGDTALRNSVEGAEDDEDGAVSDLAALSPPVSEKDTVIGIAASGATPYTLAALAEARRRGASTVLIACNPAARADVDHVIVLDTGAEVLPGSTRLKAGTATKLALNTISTGAMARAGYVFDGYMTNMRPVNAKLRARAVRIVTAITGIDSTVANAVLADANWSIPLAIVMTKKGCDADAGQRLLAANKGILRDALQ